MQTKDFYGNTLNIGDEVEVYKQIGCKGLKCRAKIRKIAKVPSIKKPLVWVEGIAGGWHPDALIKI